MLKLTEDEARQMVDLIDDVEWVSQGGIQAMSTTSEGYNGTVLTLHSRNASFNVRVWETWGFLEVWRHPYGKKSKLLYRGNTHNGPRDWMRIRDAILQSEGYLDATGRLLGAAAEDAAAIAEAEIEI